MSMATVGGGAAPPGELGNHSHREGAMPPPRPQMSQPHTFIFIFYSADEGSIEDAKRADEFTLQVLRDMQALARLYSLNLANN